MAATIEMISMTPQAGNPSSPTIGPNQNMDIPLSPDIYGAVLPHLRRPTFVSQPEQSNISLYDGVPQPTPHLFTNSKAFEDHIETTSKPHTRIVSICSKSSMKPLGVTETAMRKLMNAYNIDSSFFGHVVSFGDKPRSSDAGHGGMTVKQQEDGTYDIHYLFTYAESYEAGGSTCFTIRQVSVFHRYCPSSEGNLWVFLHANPRSKLELQLEAELSSDQGLGCRDWFSLHLLVFSTYLGNWRWCIRNMGDEIEETVDMALTMDLISKNGRNNDHLVKMLEPQYLGDKLVPLSSRLNVALSTVRKMGEINNIFRSKSLSTNAEFQKVADATAYHATNLEGYLRSVEVLERKVQGISNLLAVTLTLKNQSVTIDINNKMLGLSSASFEDNTTVRVVTMVTLVYLPASFVSSILGMNLFSFDGDRHPEFTISKRFWIFVVLAVPLTLLTLGSWYFLSKWRRSRQRSVEEGYEQ